MNLSLPRRVIVCAAYAILHLAAHISARFFEVGPGISIWYPPAGLALALLVLLGPRYAPVVFFTNALTAICTSSGLGTWWAPLIFPALITANFTGAAWFARRFLGTKLLPGTLRETLIFGVVMVGSPAVVAIAGTGLLLLVGVNRPESFLDSALNWWVGDASGLLTVVPAAVVFAGAWLENKPAFRPTNQKYISKEVAMMSVQAATLVGLIWLVFAVEPLARNNAFYLCFLPLTWICLQQGLRGATLATLAITMGSLIGMHLVGSNTATVVSFLLFELTVSVVGLGLGSVVSRRNEAEKKLAKNEARFDRVISGAQLGLWDLDIAARHVSQNQHSAAMLGYRTEDLEPLFETWQKLIHPEDVESMRKALVDHIEGRSPLYDVEYRIRGRDHHWRWLYSRGSVVARDASGKPLKVSGTHLDITARKTAEAEAGRLMEIIGATTDFVLIADASGHVLYANRALLKLLGHTDAGALFQHPLETVFKDSAAKILRDEVIRTALRASSSHGELTLHCAQGREVHVSHVTLAHRDEANDTTILSIVMRDITRQKQAEAERIEQERKILQIQKSESLGVLAGGIAHDFNNLLATMLGNANLARLDLPVNSPIHEPLAQVENAATRAAALCQQMLAYAGRSPLAFEEVDLNALIKETRQLFQVSIGKKIVIDLQLSHPLAPIKAAPAQIQQVIMNLTLNASDAIGDKEGRITIKTVSKYLNTGELCTQFQNSSLPSGSYVLLEVADTGCGILPESLARIFEPFYTTKFTGHGLGLAAVAGTVKSHKGAIRVSSTPGQGSSFQILFPDLRCSRPPFAPDRQTSENWRGSGVVLVVDDEPGVRTVISKTLESFGFTTVTAADGVEAVERFREHSEKLQLVLLDLTMPRMNGEETFVAMQQLRPSVPVILMSGFTEKLTLEKFAQTKPAGFLAKPFTRSVLQARLHALMERN
ncbi:MAG: PAS domain S-box protein [Nibricoccus sp.]